MLQCLQGSNDRGTGLLSWRNFKRKHGSVAAKPPGTPDLPGFLEATKVATVACWTPSPAEAVEDSASPPVALPLPFPLPFFSLSDSRFPRLWAAAAAAPAAPAPAAGLASTVGRDTAPSQPEARRQCDNGQPGHGASSGHM
jgi:hypothetical protein